MISQKHFYKFIYDIQNGPDAVYTEGMLSTVASFLIDRRMNKQPNFYHPTYFTQDITVNITV